MMRMSRRGFLTGTKSKPAPAPVAPSPSGAPSRSFLEDFYAARSQASNPPLVYEPTTFVWDEALIARAKTRKEK